MRTIPCTTCGQPSTSGRCLTCFRKIPARERSGAYGRFQLHPSHLLTRNLSRRERAAALTVCEHVPDPAEARTILAMLGLVSQ